MDAVIGECLENLLGGDSTDSCDSVTAVGDSDACSVPAAAGPPPPTTPRRKTATRKRTKKKASRLLISAEKTQVCEQLTERMESESTVGAVVDIARSEKHLSYFPSRGESLVKDEAPWHGLTAVLCKKYVDLYRECSTKADKYLIFQVKWDSSVTSLVEQQPLPSSLSVKLSDADRFAVGFALGAAAWKWCGGLIEEMVRKMQQIQPESTVPSYSNVHVYRFFGAALCRAISTLDRKIGRVLKQKKDPKPLDTGMLSLLKSLRVAQDDKGPGTVPNQLLERDHGGMSFLKPEFEEFASGAVVRIVAHVNADCYKRFGKDMVKVATTALTCDRMVLVPLISAVNQHLSNSAVSEDVIVAVGKELINKVLHAICEEVVDSWEQDQVLASGNVTTKGQNLRDVIHVSKS